METNSSKPDKIRVRVEECLDAIGLTRNGVFDVFYIEGPNGAIEVTRENADEVELQIRSNIAERYPDLAR